MRKFIHKAIAGIMLAAMVFTTMPTSLVHAEELLVATHTHAAEESSLHVTEEELAAGKVFLATEDMVTKEGVLTVEGGNYDRVVIPRSIQATKVVIKHVTAEELAVESGTKCTFEITDCTIGKFSVVAPEVDALDFAKITAMLTSGMEASAVAAAVQAYQNEKAAIEETMPEIVIKGTTEIPVITMSGNAKLDVSEAEVAAIQVNGSGKQSRTKIELNGFDGALEVAQEEAVSGVNSVLNLKLKNSELSSMKVDGLENTICYVEGDKDSNIAQTNITGAAQVILNAAATEVIMDEKAEKASLRLYSDVETLVVAGDNNQLTVAASAVVENATVEGDNVKVNNSGKLENSTITGTGSEVVFVPVYATPTPIPTPVPTITPEPEITPDPEPEPEPEVHVHTWNIEKATCNTAKVCTDPECGYLEESATGLHDFTKLVSTKKPTCTEGGFSTYQCAYCEETEERDITAPAGHTVTVWTVGEAVEGTNCTYTQTGSCDVCQTVLTSDTTVEKHNADLKVEITLEATCQAQGTKAYKCPDCGVVIKTENYSNSEAHKWDNGTAEAGKTEYTCQVSGCTATKSVVSMTSEGIANDVLDANTQVAVSDVVISMDDGVLNQIADTAPEVTEPVSVKLTADVLSGADKEAAVETLSAEDKEQLGDSEIYDLNMLVNDEPVSEFDGSVTVRIPYTLEEGEDPDSIVVWYIDDNGTVTSVQGTYYDGFVTFETTHFSYYTVVRLTPAQRCELFGHLYLSKETNPTCTEDGYITKICQRCQDTQVEAGKKATGHSMDEEVLEEADCQHKGKKKHFCKHCDFKQEVETPKGEHKPKEHERHEATCTKHGWIGYKCDCGYHKNEELKPLGHHRGQDGKCEHCQMNMDCEHNYILTMVKNADAANCDDELVLQYTCPVCGSVVEEETVPAIAGTHASRTLEYFSFYPYGKAFGGFVALDGCLCTEGSTFAYVTLDAWDAWENHYDEETDEDGTCHKVTTYVKEDVRVEIKYTDVPKTGCLVARDVEVLVYKADELVKTMKKSGIGEVHDYQMTAELAEGSISCEDGAIVTHICRTCGIVGGTWETTGHETFEKEEIDLFQHEGSCGGTVKLYGCACGEEQWVNTWDDMHDLDMEWTEAVEADGLLHEYFNVSCKTCGYHYTQDKTILSQTGCQAEVNINWQYFMGEEKIAEYVIERTEGRHDTYQKAELLDGSASCEDGVRITEYCRTCGEELYSWTNYGHYTGVKEEVDTSAYDGSCGGFFRLYGCPCGEEQWFSTPGGEHEFESKWETVTDDTGLEHEVRTASCRNCSINYVRDIVRAENEDCTAVVSYDYKCYADTTLIFDAAYTRLEEAHDMYCAEAALVDGATNCTEGITFTEKCRNCDRTYQGSGDWHYGVNEEISLADYGITCGGSIIHHKCPCGEEDWTEIDLLCDTGYSWDDMRDNLELVEEKEDGTRVYRREFVCAVTEPKCNGHFAMELVEVPVDSCHTEGEGFFCIDTDLDGVYETRVSAGWGTSGTHHDYGEQEITYTTAADGTPLEVRTTACQNCDNAKETHTYADYLGDESYRYNYSVEYVEDDFSSLRSWEYNFTDSNCTVTEKFTQSNGYSHSYETVPACVADRVIEYATCTQYGHGICLMCGNDNPLRYHGPRGHEFNYNSELGEYVCAECGLVNNNGSSGAIVLEDVSDETTYIANYTNSKKLVYEIFVFLVTENEDIMTDLAVTDSGATYNIGTASLSKAAVAAWAEANGVTGAYDVMFSFIPKNASVDTTYNIIFTKPHTWATKAELVAGGVSCEDGVVITDYCTECGLVKNSETVTHHYDVELQTVDLSNVEGACGSKFAYWKCVCGEHWGMQHPNCDFDWNYEWVDNGDGTGYNFYTSNCQNCDVWYTQKVVSEKNEDCTATITHTYTIYSSEEVIGEIIYENLEESHDIYTASSVLKDGATTCTDGVTVTRKCRDCDYSDTYESASHVWVELERIYLPAYENTCGRFIETYEKCACGERRGTGRNTPCSMSSTSEYVTDENGVGHTIWTYTCSKCDLTYTKDSVFTPGENCTRTETNTYTFYVAGTEVGSSSYSRVEDWHDTYTASSVLADGATTCTEGVTITRKCRDCDYSYTSQSTSHERAELEKAIFPAHESTCGRFVESYGECACGENKGFSGKQPCSTRGTHEYVTDENGVGHDVSTYTCINCSLSYTVDRVTVPGENCTCTRTYTYTFYVAGEEAGTASYSIVEEMHDTYNSSSVLADGATTCNDGATVTRQCRDCDYSYTFDTLYHEVAEVNCIDLSTIEGTCGGMITLKKCACGENQWVGSDDLCSLNVTFKSVTDENGISHDVWTNTCTNCDVSYTEDRATKKGENCTCTREYTYIFYVAETEVGSFSYSRVEEMHDTYTASAELVTEGTTCEDGVTVTRKCHDCDYGETYKTKNHEDVEQKRIDFSDYENTCGGEAVYYECTCGKSKGWSRTFSCSMSDAYEYITDENGIGHNIWTNTCADCDMSYVQNTINTAGENCTCTIEHTFTFYVAGTEVGSFSYSVVEEMHNSYISSTTLITEGTTCEAGIVCEDTCYNCGRVKKYNAYYHAGAREEIDLSQYDTCGGSVAVYACACGEAVYAEGSVVCNTGSSWGSMPWNNYGEEETTETGAVAYAEYTCADCGFVYKFKRVRKTVDETSEVIETYLLLEDREVRIGISN